MNKLDNYSNYPGSFPSNHTHQFYKDPFYKDPYVQSLALKNKHSQYQKISEHGPTTSPLINLKNPEAAQEWYSRWKARFSKTLSISQKNSNLLPFFSPKHYGPYDPEIFATSRGLSSYKSIHSFCTTQLNALKNHQKTVQDGLVFLYLEDLQAILKEISDQKLIPFVRKLSDKVKAHQSAPLLLTLEAVPHPTVPTLLALERICFELLDDPSSLPPEERELLDCLIEGCDRIRSSSLAPLIDEDTTTLQKELEQLSSRYNDYSKTLLEGMRKIDSTLSKKIFSSTQTESSFQKSHPLEDSLQQLCSLLENPEASIFLKSSEIHPYMISFRKDLINQKQMIANYTKELHEDLQQTQQKLDILHLQQTQVETAKEELQNQPSISMPNIFSDEVFCASADHPADVVICRMALSLFAVYEEILLANKSYILKCLASLKPMETFLDEGYRRSFALKTLAITP